MAKIFTPPEHPATFAKLLASKVELSSAYASELAHKKKTPSLEKAVAFERAYGIPPAFWLKWSAAA